MFIAPIWLIPKSKMFHSVLLVEDIKPILLSFLKGLLKPYVPDRINYINAEAIEKN